MNKTLSEIEIQYVGDIVKFFCEQYILMVKPNRIDRREELQKLIANQIENRLLNTNLIRNYRVEVILYPINERRDVVIDNLLEDKDTEVGSKINVSIEHRDRTMDFYETIIKV